MEIEIINDLKSAKSRSSKKTSHVQVTDFTDYIEYLFAAGLPKGMYQHSANTLQKWATRLGYRSPSSLTMILKGQRIPSNDMTRAFIKDLSLSGIEKEYFELLIELEKLKRKKKDTVEIIEKLTNIRKTDSYFEMDMKKFSAMSKWYFLVIKQLVATPDFINDVDWIYKKLNKSITPMQIKDAINTMVDLGILIMDTENSLRVTTKSLITTNDTPSSAIRIHHDGMIERALNALHKHETTSRQISSLTFQMDRDRVDEARKELLDFLKTYKNKYYNDSASEVYQLNIQLFSHTSGNKGYL